MAFVGVVVAIVVVTACCRWVATSTEFKPELNNFNDINRLVCQSFLEALL
jgi:hypothetical protein